MTQQRLRDRDSQRFGCLQVDDQLETGRLLDRDVGRLGALQHLVHQMGRAAQLIGGRRAVGEQRTCIGLAAVDWSAFPVLAEIIERLASLERPKSEARFGRSVKVSRVRGRSIWRIPALEVSDVLPVEYGATHLQQRVCSDASPLHVPVAFHALANHVVDDRFSAGAREWLSSRPA